MLVNRERAFARLEAELSGLDPVPPRVSYYDPYSETIVALEQADTAIKLPIAVSGTGRILDMLDIPRPLRGLYRRLTVWALVRHAPSSVIGLHGGLSKLLQALGVDALLFPFALDPLGIRDYWNTEILPFLKGYPNSYRGCKIFLHYLCDQELGSLSGNDHEFIRSFRGPPGHLYRSLEIGKVFLSSSEQSAVVRYLDDMVLAIRAGKSVPADELREAAVLACSMEHAMRPFQIAKVFPVDVRVRTSANLDGGISVHIRFHMAKQKSEQKKFPMLRKISAGWIPIFQEFHGRRLECAASPIYCDNFLNRVSHDASLTPEVVAASYFRLSPSEISQCVKIVSKKILGHARSCNDYRHTAAQRMVDAGASHEELAAFLGQRQIRTANQYFNTSNDTVERINKALAISPAFRRIDSLYRSIDEAKLKAGSPDKQISGIVHGVPIPLIGGCDLGVGLCPKHPVVACYGCYKFVPIKRVDRHEKVADVMRSAVRRFFDRAPEGEGSSPYGQLRETLETIEAIIDDLKGKE